MDTICSNETYTDNGFNTAVEGTYTDTMVNWKEACQLSSYLRLPKFPKLNTIGKYAFLKRKNLYNQNPKTPKIHRCLFCFLVPFTGYLFANLAPSRCFDIFLTKLYAITTANTAHHTTANPCFNK